MEKNDPIAIVCAKITDPLLMPDNVIGHCYACFCMVQFRPHAPLGSKICFECAVPLIEAGAELMTTPRMLEEARSYFRKQRH